MVNNYKVSIISVHGSYREIADRARATVGLKGGDKTISNKYMRRLYLSEHSPIRVRTFVIHVENVPYWLSMHFVRHHEGVVPFISTQRDDRNPKIIDRNSEPQGNLVTMELCLNSQAFINISRKRLCKNAHKEAQKLWSQVIKELSKIDKPLASVCVKECIYRGFCPEMKSCGYCKSDLFKIELEEYRTGQYDKDVRHQYCSPEQIGF